MYISITDLFCSTPEANTTLLINYTQIKIIRKQTRKTKCFCEIHADRDNVCGLLLFPVSKRALNKYLSNK